MVWVESAACRESSILKKFIVAFYSVQQTIKMYGKVNTMSDTPCATCTTHASQWHGWDQMGNPCLWDIIPNLLDYQA